MMAIAGRNNTAPGHTAAEAAFPQNHQPEAKARSSPPCRGAWTSSVRRGPRDFAGLSLAEARQGTLHAKLIMVRIAIRRIRGNGPPGVGTVKARSLLQWMRASVSRSFLWVRNLAPQLWVDLEGSDLDIWGLSRVHRSTHGATPLLEGLPEALISLVPGSALSGD